MHRFYTLYFIYNSHITYIILFIPCMYHKDHTWYTIGGFHTLSFVYNVHATTAVYTVRMYILVQCLCICVWHAMSVSSEG